MDIERGLKYHENHSKDFDVQGDHCKIERCRSYTEPAAKKGGEFNKRENNKLSLCYHDEARWVNDRQLCSSFINSHVIYPIYYTNTFLQTKW